MTKIIKKFHAATDVDPHAEIYYVDPTDFTQQFLGSPKWRFNFGIRIY